MSELEWTELTPTEPGAYWVVTRSDREPFLVEVHVAFGGLHVDRAGCSRWLSAWAEETTPCWYGPLESPHPPERRDRMAERMQAIEAAIEALREQEKRDRAAEVREALKRITANIARATRDLDETARIARRAFGD